MHYDLRLELEGVLKSWAVPKGPSPNPADKRLAVHVEDHPQDYGDFEGIIPEGNYGAGAVIVWDRGVWVPLEDPVAGLAKGKLLFELRGYKLRGRWTLVRTREDWLFIKERDGHAVEAEDFQFPEDSIYSGLMVEQLRESHLKATEIEEGLEKAGARKSVLNAREVEVMLAESRDTAFSDPDWLFEIKYDGYRIVAARESGSCVLISRNGNDLTHTFPEVALAVSRLPFEHLVMDGEVVVHDERGLPSFQLLQKRGRLSRASDIKRKARELPATLYLFDLLGFEGYDLRSLPLTERKEWLRRVLPSAGPLRYCDHIEGEGEAMFAEVTRLNLEGIVGKRKGSRYTGGRSDGWYKIRVDQTDDFVVVGFTEPKGSRGGFGALHVAQFRDGELRYAGRVGTGFRQSELKEIRGDLDTIVVTEPRFEGEYPAANADVWVKPELVVEVKFKEVTEQNLLRHPVFLRFREDKRPEECVWGIQELEEPVPVTDFSPGARMVPFTNLDKVFWPEDGYTKGDLIEYYRAIAPWILPYLKQRPLVMTRYPDGIHGKSFFQKDAPGFAPDWIRTERLWSEGSQRELDYFVCGDVESVLYVANLASIPLHIWSSTIDHLESPDWCILDLDPKDAPFSYVVRVALTVKRLLNEIELPCYVKTSGSTGLHVLIPLGRSCTYDQSRSFAQLLATVIQEEEPEAATVTRSLSRRDGKVYIDCIQNGHGRLLVSPFSVRPLPGAPVSTPLLWDELDDSLAIENFHIGNVPDRCVELGSDPLAGVLEDAPDLSRALELLLARFE